MITELNRPEIMKLSETTTLKEIAQLPFIQPPCIRFELGKIENIAHLAIRNGICLNDCYQELYRMNREPHWELTFIDKAGEDTSVCIDFVSDE